MFEKATRMKLRFSYKGQISAEDLWDLSTKELDQVYQTLCAERSESSGDSLMEKAPTIARQSLELKIEIVTHVFNVKVQEMKIRESLAENRHRKDRIAVIITEKQEQGLKDMSIDELEKAMNSL